MAFQPPPYILYNHVVLPRWHPGQILDDHLPPLQPLPLPNPKARRTPSADLGQLDHYLPDELLVEIIRELDLASLLTFRLVNIRAADRPSLTRTLESDPVREAIAAEHEALTGRGRVLVRVSGTEPLIRVMVEAPSAEETDAVCAVA